MLDKLLIEATYLQKGRVDSFIIPTFWKIPWIGEHSQTQILVGNSFESKANDRKYTIELN